MKKTYIIAALLCLAGCKEGDPEIIHVPSKWNLEATLEFTSEIHKEVGNGTSEATFTFVSSQENFTVTTDRPWCSAEVEENNRLVVSVEPNSYNNERRAVITIVAGIYDNVTAPKTVTVKQAAGATVIPAVGEIYGTGIVYWSSTAIDTAGFRTVSLKRLYGIDAQWSTEQAEVGLTDTKYGANNVAKLTDLSSYPAFNFCDTLPESMGQGWYLPARDEFTGIMTLYNGGITAVKALPTSEEQANRATFEALLTRHGGDPFNTDITGNGQSYWTSTESNWEDAHYVRVWSYAASTASKTGSARGARCIQYFDMR